MRVLLTGAAGFIGSHVCDRLLKDGHDVLGFDNFNAFYDPQIKDRNLASALEKPRFELVRGDITDAKLVNDTFGSFQPDRIVHLAAWAGVRPSIENPLVYQQVNLGGTMNLLEACRTHGVEYFVFASSSSVYGDRDQVPFGEDDHVGQPVSPYAATKRAGELLCYTWHHLFGLNTHCLRFFTVYGPRQRPEMAIHLFTDRIAKGETITLFGDGTTSRDYTFVDDIVDGVVASLERCEGYRIYNLGESKTTRLDELVTLISDALGLEAIVEHLPTQPGDVTRTFADVSRARTELGYAPQVSMREGIARFVSWYRDQD